MGVEKVPERLKALALDLGEEVVKRIVKEVVRPTIEEVVKESPNKIDDLLLPFLDQLEAALLEKADKIDGQPG